MTTGATTPVTPVYAGIGRRFGALAIDNVVYVGAYLAALLVTAVIGQVSAALAAVLLVLLLLFGGLAAGVYTLYRLAVRGDSIGKSAMGLQVVGLQDGQPIGWGRALLRGFVLGLISFLTLGVGLLVLAIVASNHPRKQGWHDLAVDSVVLDRRASPPPALTGPPPVQAASSYPAVSFPAAPADPGPVEAPGWSAAPQVVAAPPVPVPPAPLPEPAPVSYAPASPGPAPYAAAPTTGLISAVPGVGAAAPVVAPAAPAAMPEDPLEHTRIVARTGSWTLRLSDGTEVAIHGDGLIGRAPSPRDGEQVAHLVPVADPERSVSKTHLAFGVDGGTAWVEDRGSTNGTVLLLADGTEQPCADGVRVPLPNGAAVRAGQERLEFLRR